MKRVVLIVLGVVLLLISVPLLVGGTILAAWASDDPTIEGRIGRVDSTGYAVVSDRVQVDWEWPLADRWDITIGVENTGSDLPSFIGYGPTEAVEGYLAGSPYTLVYSIGTGDEVGTRDVEVPGTEAPGPPGDQDFWIEQSSGSGRQSLELAPGQGDYRFVAMNADGSAGVSLAVYGSMRVPFLQPVGIGMAVFGGLLAILGIVLLILGIRSKPKPPATGYAPAQQYPGAQYPAGQQYAGQYPGGQQQYPGGQQYPGSQQAPPGQQYPSAQYPGSQQYTAGQQYAGGQQYTGAPAPGTAAPGGQAPGAQAPGAQAPGAQVPPGQPQGAPAQGTPPANTPAPGSQPPASTPVPPATQPPAAQEPTDEETPEKDK